ncbi:MAG: aldose epimerase family protein [Flavobacteriaceae bacterium]
MKQVTINNGILSLTALDYGAVIQKLILHDKNGQPVNVVVGLEDAEDYLQDKISLGAVVGRFAGRISGGGFSLVKQRYELFQEKGVHLHGGREGFAKKFWKVQVNKNDHAPALIFSYLSPHLEEGYPGELKTQVTYTLKKNALHILHEAVTDRPTVVNLTNHSYFRLDDMATIDHYNLKLHCPSMLQTDQKLLPTGQLLEVEGTEFDFREEKRVESTRMDTPFVCENGNGLVGEVFSEKSGIRMRISSNQPAVVVYTPPGFPAICFETQNFPDAPNMPQFPSSVLMPGERYINSAIFEFDLVN